MPRVTRIEALLAQYRHADLVAALSRVFDDRDSKEVATWMETIRGREPIVLVGAGFTLNSYSKDSGEVVERSRIPTWDDLTQAWASAIGVRPEAYDPPFLADLYRRHAGEHTYITSLLASLPNEEIAPGAAHQALFNYPAHAILTTNNLDTMLDPLASERNWDRVVSDSEVPPTRGDRRQLLYLHGHRSNPGGWVFTRTEYEQYTEGRPLLTARIRQLLAQFPLLVLGFGLTDPNFHHIYMRIGRETMRRHPPGLAVMIGGELPEAVRGHWRDAGLRLVRLQFGDTYPPSPSHAMRQFLEISPTNAEKPDHEYLKQIVRDAETPGLGMQRVRDCYPILDRLRKQDPQVHQLQWDLLVEALLVGAKDAERNFVVSSPPLSRKQVGEAYWLSLSDTDRQKLEGSAVSFTVLPEVRFSVSHLVCRLADHILARSDQGLTLLLKWLDMWLSLAEAHQSTFGYFDVVTLDLVGWASVEFLRGSSSSGAGESAAATECKAMIARAIAISRIHGVSAAESRLTRDLVSIGGSVAPPSSVWPGVEEGHPLHAALNGDLRRAHDGYREEMRRAGRENNVWREYLATLGALETGAALRDREGRSLPGEMEGEAVAEAELSSLRQRKSELSSVPAIQAWERRVADDVQGATAAGARRLRDEPEAPFAESSHVDGLRRLLLAQRGCPAGLILKLSTAAYLSGSSCASWLAGFLEVGISEGDSSVRKRLRAGMEDLGQSPAAGDVVGRTLAWVLTDGPTHRRGLMHRLAVVPGLVRTLGANCTSVVDLLRVCRDTVGSELSDVLGWHRVTDEYANALACFAATTLDGGWLEAWIEHRGWVEASGHPFLVLGAEQMPWSASYQLDRDRRLELTEEAISLMTRRSVGPALHRDRSVWPLAELLLGGAPLPESRREPVRLACESILGQSLSSPEIALDYFGTLRPCLHILSASCSPALFEAHCVSLVHAMGGALTTSTPLTLRETWDGLLAILCDVDEWGLSVPSLYLEFGEVFHVEPAGGHAWTRLRESMGRGTLNDAALSLTIHGFLIVAKHLRRASPRESDWYLDQAIEFFETGVGRFHESRVRALPSLWGRHWPRARAVLLAAVHRRGNLGTGAQRNADRDTRAASAFGLALDLARAENHDALSIEFLREFAGIASFHTGSPSTEIANVAAFLLVECIARGITPLTEEFASALLGCARDGRSTVRMGAAFAAGWFSRLREPRVASLGDQLASMFDGETRAIVLRQLAFGRVVDRPQSTRASSDKGSAAARR